LFDIDGLYSFSRVDVCVGAKSPMFLERYGGDGCDCDDERMMALMLFVAIAVRMKNDFAIRDFKELIAEFPTSSLVEKAREELGKLEVQKP
jgi:hypothetical protein